MCQRHKTHNHALQVAGPCHTNICKELKACTLQMTRYIGEQLSVKSKTSAQTTLVGGCRRRVKWVKGLELMRTLALVTKVEHYALVCPCLHISTRWLEDGGSQSGA